MADCCALVIVVVTLLLFFSEETASTVDEVMVKMGPELVVCDKSAPLGALLDTTCMLKLTSTLLFSPPPFGGELNQRS